MNARPTMLEKLPPEQQVIRARCFPTDTFVEFTREEIEQSIPERFGKIVQTYPDRIAIKTEDQVLTYAELNAMANRAAHAIIAQRGYKSEPVGILLETGAALMAAMLGVLKAGKFFVLLDSSFPKSRIEALLQDSETGVVVTDSQHLPLTADVTNHGYRVIQLESIDCDISNDDLGLSIVPDALAFITYTSGSTGHPKGVIWNHRNLLHNLMLWTNLCHVSAQDRLCVLTEGTANTVMNSLVSLLTGAAMMPFRVQKEGINRLTAWLSREAITICPIGAPLFRSLACTLADTVNFTNLRVLRLTSANVQPNDVELYKKFFPPSCLLAIGLNSSETGLSRIYFLDHDSDFASSDLAVGYAVEDKGILLVDDEGREVGLNEVGEIVVRSPYLASGYWKNPALTKAKFKTDPHRGGDRLFFTGDLGLMLSDGRLIHKGRKDFRVKIRGYGVDLAEVEKTVLTHDSISEAVVLSQTNELGENHLVVYFTSPNQPVPSVSELRRFLKVKLADFMIPSHFIKLDALPLTPNGKINRKALPAPDRSRPNLDTAYIAADTVAEAKLVQIWEEVLGIRGIGICDNFFDLGGHSLAASSLVAKLNCEFAVDLQIGVLVSSPTIKRLAEHIEAQRDKRQNREWAYLFQVQPGNGRTPVFFLPGGIGGEAEFFVYARLARHIGSDYPFYGLRARSALGTQASHASVEAMAADYLNEIRSLQPVGPYYIVGECAGGIVAYELAQQVQARGQKIALLILMDTPRPNLSLEVARRVRRRFQPVLESHLVRGLEELTQQLRGRAFMEKISYLISKREKIIPQLVADREFVQPSGVGNPREYVQRSYSRAIYRYRPKPYPGKIILLVSEEAERADPTLGWKDFVSGGIEVSIVPGNHRTYIRDHVQNTAGRLREYLEAAESKAFVS